MAGLRSRTSRWRGGAQAARIAAALTGAVLPSVCLADGITGFVEILANRSNARVEDSAGDTTTLDATSLTERTNLTLTDTLYPYLQLRAGGVVERDATWVSVDGQDSDSTLTRIAPFVSLDLTNPFVTAGVGYDRQQERLAGSGSAVPANVRETYRAALGFRPEDLPSLSLQVLRTDTFDADRTSQDTVNDHASWSSRYLPVRQLDVSYQGTYDRQRDRVAGVEVRDLINSGRISYADRFLADRVSLTGTYNVSEQATDTIATGNGNVAVQVFPFAGLSGITDTPEEGALDPNPALIDGNLTAGVGVNLGLPPIGGDARPRSIGLDLATPTDVTTFRVWVSVDLPPTIANSFRWRLFVSENNQDWTAGPSPTGATFGPFDRRFEITFPTVRARFVKLVVDPLLGTVPDASNFRDISVTELQAFLSRPAKDVAGHTSRISQIYDFGARARLWDAPSLLYDFYYFGTRSAALSTSTYTVSNGLSVSHRFGPLVSANARVSRDDQEVPDHRQVAYLFTGSIVATPLPTLTHNLSVTARREVVGDQATRAASVFLSNVAALYRGVDVSLSAGMSTATQPDQSQTRGTQLNVGATLVPNRWTTMNVSVSSTASTVTGSAKETTPSRARRAEVSVSCTPLSTLYLLADVGWNAETGRKDNTTQNYSVSWSPFRDGALQFGVSYSEQLRSEDNAKETAITPSIRWNVARRATLDLSYQNTVSDSVSQRSRTQAYGADFRMTF